LKTIIHLISHDVPYPADYGGVIDIFHSIRTLYEKGVLVHLHCYEYGRGRQPELEKYCASVHYYPRQKKFSLTSPYIVESRRNEEMAERLLKDNYPILMEGIHCSWPLTDPRFKNRKMVLRLLNVEWVYYRGLGKTTRNWLRKLYYYNESRLLKRYEQKIGNKVPIAAIGAGDADYYREHLGATRVEYLPAFVDFIRDKEAVGKGGFCLYHGNLAIPENERVAEWLIEEVFNDNGMPLVIAGSRPSKRLVDLAHRQDNTCLAENPSNAELQDLMRKAQLHVLPAYNATGVKLKVIHALHAGRYCITDKNASLGLSQHEQLLVARDAEDMKALVAAFFDKEFTTEDEKKRKQSLQSEFDNNRNADRLIAMLR
jgi:glycosyltransferase involved in cell wall biosynthesis